MLCAKSPKCTSDMYKIYDTAHSIAIDRSLLNNMFAPTSVDLQGFIVNKKFIVKEVTVQKTVLTLHFYESRIMEIFDKIRQVLRFLIECLSSCDRKTVPYNEAKRLISCI